MSDSYENLLEGLDSPPDAPGTNTDGTSGDAAAEDVSVESSSSLARAGAGGATILGALVTTETEESPDEIDVDETDEAEAAPVPDTTELAQKRAKTRDMWREALREAGVPEDKIEGLVVKRAITNGKQRERPDYATPCQAEIVEFWKTRTDEQIEADMLKLCRRDGGKAGPLGRFADVLEAHGVDHQTAQRAAPAINDLFMQRITSIRIYATSGINELRRRRAERAGRNSQRVKYLRVRVR